MIFGKVRRFIQRFEETQQRFLRLDVEVEQNKDHIDRIYDKHIKGFYDVIRETRKELRDLKNQVDEIKSEIAAMDLRVESRLCHRDNIDDSKMQVLERFHLDAQRERELFIAQNRQLIMEMHQQSMGMILTTVNSMAESIGDALFDVCEEDLEDDE